MDISLLLTAQVLIYFIACTCLACAHFYLDREREFEVSYDESEEDERIDNVRLHGRHDQ